MNFKSIKFRLIAWYFLALFISSIVIFTAFYYITRDTLINQTDREISLHGVRILQVVGNVAANPSQPFPRSQLGQEFSEMPGMLVLITDRNGTLLTGSQLLESDSAVLKDLVSGSAGKTTPVFTARVIGSANMRLGIFPVTQGTAVTGYVLVGHPLNVIMNSLNSLVEILVVVLIFIGVLSVFGGWLIAGRTLLPVTLLSAKLKKISLENLTQKVEVLDTGDELEELTHSFNSLLGRLSESFSRERRFIGDIAHELKTPLSTLKNSIEVQLTKKRSAADYAAGLSDNLIDINNLSDSVNDVLDLAWSESDVPRARGEPVSLSALVMELTEITARLAQSKKIKVIHEISPRLTVTGHRQKLFRSLFNLLDNAVKYTPQNGKIAVTLEKIDQAARLEISNTGGGIDRADLPHVFDRFYRGRVAASVTGAGLGLAICKSILTAHGGQITVNSTPGKITTFTVILPLTSIFIKS